MTRIFYTGFLGNCISRLLVLVTFLAFFSLSVPVAGQSQTLKDTGGPISEVTIVGTQLLHINSANTHKEYDLYINLPAGYKDSSKTFPVLYLIDAQWDFPLIQAIYGEQYYDGFIPEMVIVGITWGGDHPNYDQLRAHDFTPTDISNKGTYGNAPHFLSFISKELIPFIEKNYRVKPDDRTLIGSSYGGLFSLFTLFQQQAVFNRFIFTSPAIQWDNNMVSRMNNDYSKQNNQLKAKVFTAIGEYEDVSEFENLMEEIKSKNYQELQLQTMVIKGMGHSGAKAEAYTRGLQAVFKEPEFQVSPDVLAAYSGKYAVNGMNVNLVVENGKLVAKAPGYGSLVLQAASNEDFYNIGQFMKFHFTKDQSGKVTGFNLQQYGGNTFLAKLNE